MPEALITQVRQIVQDNGPLTTTQIQSVLSQNHKITIEKETINSILYGPLHELLIRDKNENGQHTWRLKGYTFEAAKGLEMLLYKELVKKHIITTQEASLDYQLHNRKNNKTYYLDLAIIQPNKKYNIEIDGYEHIRADARLSIQKQLQKNNKLTEPEIDWMDNETSYADFKQIDSQQIFRWCSTHQPWCIRYHEELLKPHDITRNIWLIENGWTIIRFWNFEIKQTLNSCITTVQQIITKG